MKKIIRRGVPVAEAALEGAEPLSENGYKVPLTKGLIEKAMRKLALEESG